MINIDKAGEKITMVDERAVKRAEQALEALQDDFQDWLVGDLDLLKDATAALREDTASEEFLSEVCIKAHDLKGLGVTYQYPLVTRIAGSLHRLLDENTFDNGVPVEVIDNHVKAIQAVVVGKVKSADDPVGSELAKELEQMVSVFLETE